MLYADCTGRSSEIGNLPDASTFEVAPRKFLRRLRIARPQTGIRLFYLVRPVLEVVCDAGIVERRGVVWPYAQRFLEGVQRPVVLAERQVGEAEIQPALIEFRIEAQRLLVRRYRPPWPVHPAVGIAQFVPRRGVRRLR